MVLSVFNIGFGMLDKLQTVLYSRRFKCVCVCPYIVGVPEVHTHVWKVTGLLCQVT